MASLAIGFGVLLALLSGILFAIAEHFSPTIFIPAGFGIVLICLGVVARNEMARMHAMHGAALVGLIGFVVAAYRVISAKIDSGGSWGVWNRAESGQAIMAALCAIFLGLSIRSFIEARIARKKKEAEANPPPAQ